MLGPSRSVGGGGRVILWVWGLAIRGGWGTRYRL